MVKHLRSVYVMVATAHEENNTCHDVHGTYNNQTGQISCTTVPMDIKYRGQDVSPIKTVMKVHTDRSGILKPVWCAKRAPRDAIQMIQTLFSVSVVP